MLKNNKVGMRGSTEFGPNVPAFLIKLWKMVDEEKTDDLISWSESGMSFIITCQDQFARELLPLYYKHNNMASFIRQLNMYGFRKIVSPDAGGLKSEKGEMEFAHMFFIRDHHYLLQSIKRKLSSSKHNTVATDEDVTNGPQSEIISKVLTDVNILKGKQEAWDAKFNSMKKENEALWRELALFRQKHLKQEQIINKLIHFIVTIVQPRQTSNVMLRRRFPLMINDTQTPIKKITKLSGNESIQANQGSPSGPTIHEIDVADALYSASEHDQSTSSEMEYISSDLNGPTLIEVLSPESQSTPTESVPTPSEVNPELSEDGADNWLEIELTEDDMTPNPFTPINPREINPAVAEATLRDLGKDSTQNVQTPIAITIAPFPKTDSTGKQSTTGKKTIFLSDLQKDPTKKATRKPTSSKPKYNQRNTSDAKVSSTKDLLLELVTDNNATSAPTLSNSANTLRKRKVAKPTVTLRSNITGSSNSSASTGQNIKLVQNEFNTKRKGASLPEKDNDFLKFDDSFYDETQLLLTSPETKTLDASGTLVKDELNEDKVSSLLSFPSDLNVEELVEAPIVTEPTETSESNSLKDNSDALAVICSPALKDNVARELSSHVQNVQGELDNLKTLLSLDGCNLDANTLLGLFNNEDPFAYNMPPVDQEESSGGKENVGNELMTYASPNFMDLIDMFSPGSTPAPASNSNGDWSSFSSSDLNTPLPSPSPNIGFGSTSKRRKK